jgi:hypothetical protein
MLFPEMRSAEAQAYQGDGGQMNAWRKYERDIEVRQQKEMIERKAEENWNQVIAIRHALGLEDTKPTEFDKQLLWAGRITWEGDNRGR